MSTCCVNSVKLHPLPSLWLTSPDTLSNFLTVLVCQKFTHKNIAVKMNTKQQGQSRHRTRTSFPMDGHMTHTARFLSPACSVPSTRLPELESGPLLRVCGPGSNLLRAHTHTHTHTHTHGVKSFTLQFVSFGSRFAPCRCSPDAHRSVPLSVRFKLCGWRYSVQDQPLWVGADRFSRTIASLSCVDLGMFYLLRFKTIEVLMCRWKLNVRIWLVFM